MRARDITHAGVVRSFNIADWRQRWETRSKTTSVPFWQLPWVMGTDTMGEALERVKQCTLVDAIPHLTQPLLIVHGEHDSAVPVEDARKAIDAAGSTDKEVRIFTPDSADEDRVVVAVWSP